MNRAPSSPSGIENTNRWHLTQTRREIAPTISRFGCGATHSHSKPCARRRCSTSVGRWISSCRFFGGSVLYRAKLSQPRRPHAALPVVALRSAKCIALALLVLATLGCGGSGKYEGLSEQEAKRQAVQAVVYEDQQAAVTSEDTAGAETLAPDDLTVQVTTKGKTPFGNPAWSVVLSDTEDGCYRVWLWDTSRYYIRGC